MIGQEPFIDHYGQREFRLVLETCKRSTYIKTAKNLALATLLLLLVGLIQSIINTDKNVAGEQVRSSIAEMCNKSHIDICEQYD